MAPQTPERACAAALPAGPRDQLDDIFAEPLARIHKWRKDSSHASYAEAQRGMRELLREKSCLEDLRTDLAAKIREKVDVLKLKADAEQMSELVRRSGEAASARVRGALATKEQLLRAHDRCRQRLAQEEGALESGRRTAEARRAELEGLLGLYSGRLGLALAPEAPRAVRVTFTLVDPAKPEREFSLSLGLNEASEYRVTACDPAVPGLGERVARLNADADVKGRSRVALPAFLCGMRRAFLGTLSTAR